MSMPSTPVAPPAPGIARIVLEHERRGVSLQIALRGVLALFVVGTTILLPPTSGATWCLVVAAGYLLAAVGLTIWLRGGTASAIHWGWLGLYVDLLALSAVCLIADRSAGTTWTAFVLLGGFFLLPVLAATQLDVRVCVSVVVPTVVFYAIEAVASRESDAEPWASVVLRVVVLAGVGIAAVGLTRIQRSRVTAIQGLVADRTALLAELMAVTESERRSMAEHLHDGALQYILAARMDLEDARELADPAAFDRVDEALTQSSQLLRSTVSELHPAVLAQSGLAAAVDQLAQAVAQRASLTLELDTDRWPPDTRTGNDLLLFGTARELLANVARHARATRLTVRLELNGELAELTIADDGVGVDPGSLADRLAEGHIGMNSHRVKVESAGGEFRLDSSPGGGTVVRVSVPAVVLATAVPQIAR